MTTGAAGGRTEGTGGGGKLPPCHPASAAHETEKNFNDIACNLFKSWAVQTKTFGCISTSIKLQYSLLLSLIKEEV